MVAGPEEGADDGEDDDRKGRDDDAAGREAKMVVSAMVDPLHWMDLDTERKAAEEGCLAG